MKHPPEIYINGVRLACEFDGTGATAVVLDGIDIDWGREDLYDPTNPSQLTIRLLDPRGSFGSDPALFGSKIVVQTDLGVLFRGRVDDITMEPEGVADPNPAVPPEVWAVTLSASDVIADLAKIVVPGYEASLLAAQVPYYRAKYGAGFWYQSSSETRRSQIQQRMGEKGIPTVVETTDYATITPPGVTWDKYFREAIRRSGDSLYTMIQSVQLRSDSPVHTNYLPGRDALVAAKFSRSGALILTYAAGVINATLDVGSGTAYTIPCALVEIDAGAPVKSSVAHNIGSLRIEQADYVLVTEHDSADNSIGVDTWESAEAERAVANAQGATTQWDLMPVSIANTQTYLGNNVWAQSQTAADFAAVLAPIVASVNGKLMPPPFTFDLEEVDFGTTVEAVLLATWTTDAPFAFPGARYEALTGWGPAFQMIGGTLRFEQGWRAEVQFAPGPATGSTLTISELVTTNPPLLNQYATTVSLSTLGDVTRGI